MPRSAIGVDLGGTKLLVGRVSADGVVRARLQEPTDRNDVLGQIGRLVTTLAAGDAVSGVGVGVPGTVDQAAGILIQAVNLPLAGVAVSDTLASATALPVSVDNDANCAALAEHRYGAARGAKWSVTLTLGTGVGGGVVVSDELVRGARGGGAELGHIVVDRDGPPCQGSCPGHGHLEGYCSGTAVGQRAVQAGLAGDAHAVLAKAAAGDAACLALLDDTARWLGAGLVTIANAFNPQVIVIGGGFGEAAARWLVPTATAVVQREALAPNNDVTVTTAMLGSDAGLIGAAALRL